MASTLLKPSTFSSSVRLGQSITYTTLNLPRDGIRESSPPTVVYISGAGGHSSGLTRMSTFAAGHPGIGFLYPDRWTINSSRASGPNMLTDYANILLELLDALHIPNVALVAHSAGTYATLTMVDAWPKDRVLSLFFMCAAVPNGISQNKLLGLVSALPPFVLRLVTFFNSSPLVRRLAVASGSQLVPVSTRGSEYVPVTAEVERALAAHELEVGNRETLQLDMSMVFGHLPELGLDELRERLVSCEKDITWYTTKNDLFMGPEVVRKCKDVMKRCRVEIVAVDSAVHADIFMRRWVWDDIVRRYKAVVGE